MQAEIFCCDCVEKCDELACDKCFRVLSSYRKEKTGLNDIESQMVDLPDKSVFLQANGAFVYNMSESDREEFADKNLLLVGNKKVKRLPFVRNLLLLGCNRLVLVKGHREWFDYQFDDWIRADTLDIANRVVTLQAVRDYMQQHSFTFDAVLSLDDSGVLMCSYLSEQLGLRGIPFSVSTRIKNKFEFRNYCAELGICTPKYFRISADEVDEYLKTDPKDIEQNNQLICLRDSTLHVDLPVIIKNVNGAGKDFVKRCNNAQEFLEALEESLHLEDRINILVEDFYEGHEIDIDVLVHDNAVSFMTISDNFPAIEPYFYETGILAPTMHLDTEEKQTIERLVRAWLPQLDLRFAIVHFEARCRPKSLYPDSDTSDAHFLMPIEMNLRLAANDTWCMTKAIYDVDLLLEYLSSCLNVSQIEARLQRLTQVRARHQCISNRFHPGRDVRIGAIRLALADLQQSPNVIQMYLFHGSGEQLTRVDAIGWIAAQFELSKEPLDEIKRKLNAILGYIQIELD